MLTLIAALGAQTRAIGKDGGLIWRIPEDLQHFKHTTSGHPVIMGRKTWESLPAQVRPLPGRTNIVLTRASYTAEGAHVVHTTEEALATAQRAHGSDELYVIGGGEIYELFLPYADRLLITLVNDDTPGDVYFPEYAEMFTEHNVLHTDKDFRIVAFLRTTI